MNYKKEKKKTNIKLDDISCDNEDEMISLIINQLSIIQNSDDNIENVLDWFIDVIESDNQNFNKLISQSQICDILLYAFQHNVDLNQQIKILECLGITLNHIPELKSIKVFEFLLSYPSLSDPTNTSDPFILFHVLYGIYQFISKEYIQYFKESSFISNLGCFFNISESINVLIFNYITKFVENLKLDQSIINLIYLSFQYLNDNVVDIVALNIYTVYKANFEILNEKIVRQTLFKCLLYNNTNATKYILKIFTRLQSNHLFLLKKAVILNLIFNILKDNSTELTLVVLKVIYRAMQLNASLADMIFFSHKNNVLLLIIHFILNERYKIRNEAIRVLSLIFHFLPHIAKQLFLNDQLNDEFVAITQTIFDMDDNDDTLILYVNALIKFAPYSTSNNISQEFMKTFLAEDMIKRIVAMENSENEQLAETFELFWETISSIKESDILF